MKPTPTRLNLPPGIVVLIALLLPGLGFFVGYGFQSKVSSQQARVDATPSPLVAPVVRGLHPSPDDKLLAFTAVYDQSRRGSRFILDPATSKFDAVESPRGWQDLIMQWTGDGSKLLFERSKIPRVTEDAKPGLYAESLQGREVTATGLKRDEAQLLTADAAPAPEKVSTGFWTPASDLVVKTQRASSSLYMTHPGASSILLDRSSGVYLQNRPGVEQGKTVLYVVRNVTPDSKVVALFRVVDRQATKLSEELQDVVWAYVADDAKWMIICRHGPGDKDWLWTLYSVSPQRATAVKTATIPEDVIAVYWSPDAKHVLGAQGKSLWVVDVPSLQVRQLGERDDWNADAAAWFNREPAVVVAANGKLWKIAIAGGEATSLWELPNGYWH